MKGKYLFTYFQNEHTDFVSQYVVPLPSEIIYENPELVDIYGKVSLHFLRIGRKVIAYHLSQYSLKMCLVFWRHCFNSHNLFQNGG